MSDLKLAVWLSPMFPVGSFAYSHGLEWAYEAGDLGDASALHDWLCALLQSGAPRNDALLLAEAYRSAASGDVTLLGAVEELALALATSRERRLETTSQGRAFLSTMRKSWPCTAFDRIVADEIAYPVVVGIAAAGHGLALSATLEMFLLGFLSNLVTAALKLCIIGQTEGQTLIAALLPPIRAAARDAEAGSLDDLGGSCFRADLASLHHETQYTRLFRS
jgi:urease accessory protein